MRRRIRAEKARHTEEELARLSEDICRRIGVHPRVKAADTVLLYWALPDEVCTHRLVTRLAEQGKTVLLPKVVSETEMTLHRYTSVNDMERGAYGILEPSSSPCSHQDISSLFGLKSSSGASQSSPRSIAIIPGMAFDSQGHRLGRGKGYYDRLLQKYPELYRMGVCFPFQLIDSMPCDEFDMPVDEVVC